MFYSFLHLKSIFDESKAHFYGNSDTISSGINRIHRQEINIYIPVFYRIYHGPADRVHKVHHMVVPSYSPFLRLLSLEFSCSPPYPSPVASE